MFLLYQKNNPFASPDANENPTSIDVGMNANRGRKKPDQCESVLLLGRSWEIDNDAL